MEPLRKDYIEFFHGNNCRSFVGRNGKMQEIYLAPFCDEEHTLIHEVTFIRTNRVTIIPVMNV